MDVFLGNPLEVCTIRQALVSICPKPHPMVRSQGQNVRARAFPRVRCGCVAVGAALSPPLGVAGGGRCSTREDEKRNSNRSLRKVSFLGFSSGRVPNFGAPGCEPQLQLFERGRRPFAEMCFCCLKKRKRPPDGFERNLSLGNIASFCLLGTKDANGTIVTLVSDRHLKMWMHTRWRWTPMYAAT